MPILLVKSGCIGAVLCRVRDDEGGALKRWGKMGKLHRAKRSSAACFLFVLCKDSSRGGLREFILDHIGRIPSQFRCDQLAMDSNGFIIWIHIDQEAGDSELSSVLQ